jgi:hypothetical protein
MYAIIGIGPNDVDIPLLVFTSWQKGFDYLVENGLVKKRYLSITYKFRYVKTGPEFTVTKNFYEERESFQETIDQLGDKLISIDEKEHQEGEEVSVKVDFDSLDEGADLLHKFFLNGSYYGGCGDCHHLELRKIEEGQPIVGWDLD